jgi:hypothetical protein
MVYLNPIFTSQNYRRIQYMLWDFRLFRNLGSGKETLEVSDKTDLRPVSEEMRSKPSITRSLILIAKRS